MKIMYMVGYIFTIVGGFIIGLGFASGSEVMIILFGGIFFSVGLMFSVAGIRDTIRRRTILTKGERKIGKVVGYDDDDVIVNGIPYAIILVEYNNGRDTMVFPLKSESIHPQLWPIGSDVYFYIYRGQFDWKKELVSSHSSVEY